jgi:glycosyltransferase involved in cell wall biosynthesis
MINKPLVSIIVVTYNSSKYVIETLESARLQSYKNVELIVTDDSSSDDTVEICKNWGLLHASHFVNFTIIESRQNQGIASNCNKGLLGASGEWDKTDRGRRHIVAKLRGRLH